jgi:hypothetical protein
MLKFKKIFREISVGKIFYLYLNDVLSKFINIRHLWQLRVFIFLHRSLLCALPLGKLKPITLAPWVILYYCYDVVLKLSTWQILSIGNHYKKSFNEILQVCQFSVSLSPNFCLSLVFLQNTQVLFLHKNF